MDEKDYLQPFFRQARCCDEAETLHVMVSWKALQLGGSSPRVVAACCSFRVQTLSGPKQKDKLMFSLDTVTPETRELKKSPTSAVFHLKLQTWTSELTFLDYESPFRFGHENGESTLA